MYCVIYEFKVDKNQEEQFKILWHLLTLKIKEDKSSLGSRLHKVIDSQDTWVAYAQWPSKEIYDNSPTDPTFENTRKLFLDTCREICILYQMDVVDDLLILQSTNLSNNASHQ